MAKAVNAGKVFINSYETEGGVEPPFKGIEKFGHRREKGFDALYEFS